MKYDKQQFDVGGKLITPNVLRKMSFKEIKEIAEKKNINIPEEELDREELIEIILDSKFGFPK